MSEIGVSQKRQLLVISVKLRIVLTKLVRILDVVFGHALIEDALSRLIWGENLPHSVAQLISEFATRCFGVRGFVPLVAVIPYRGIGESFVSHFYLEHLRRFRTLSLRDTCESDAPIVKTHKLAHTL